MKYEPIIRNGVMIFNLRKAIYGSFYGVWDKWLKIATKRGLKLVVHTNEGTATFENAKEYLRGAKRLERYYKNPNEPMVFWGRCFLKDIKLRDKRKKLEEKVRNTDGEILTSILTKMKETKPELYAKLRNSFI